MAGARNRVQPAIVRRDNEFMGDLAAWERANAGDNDEQLDRLRRNLQKVRELELTEKQERSREEGRSLFVTQDIGAGEVFTPENLRSIRPAFGMAPMYYEEVLGKKARVSVPRGTPMAWEYVE